MTTTPNPLIALDAITAHTADCDLSDPMRDFDLHDYSHMTERELLTDPNMTYRADYADEYDIAPDHFYALRTALHALLDAARDSDYYRTALSLRALDHSLCPMHMIDYAICFDDNDPTCALIRAIFPSHDT